jgi:PIN domain nuclease of toxin-antitoxin system
MTALLLDTHALIWWLTSSPRLSAAARDAIDDPANDIFVSVVSAYEVALKQTLGRLPADLPDLLRAVPRSGFRWLDLGPGHAEAAGRLPLDHRDPWDRLILAQARAEGLAIVSVDRAFAGTGVAVFW